MVRLLLKIFLAYWMAAGVVILISDFEPHRQIHNPELIDALDSSLAMNSRTLVDAYESGHCREVQQRLSTARDGLYLADKNGHFLCGDPGISDVGKVIESAKGHDRRMTANYATFQLIATPVKAPAGAQYILVYKNGYDTALRVYGLLPGYTTICISCVVTLFLAILLALPIRRLRKAAGQIALGRLDARVKWGTLTSKWPRLTGGDDIDQLVRDFNYMAERLQSLTDAQRLLLRDVSHELRSPLTRLGVALGLARTESTITMNEHLDRIDSEAMQLNSLIGQILSLSHVDLMQEIDEARVFSVSDLVFDLLPDLEYEAAHHGCQIDAAIGAGCYVRGDDELLRAAIENILRNAIKYAAGCGPIRMQIVEELRSAENFCAIRVIDNGPGIPEHELHSVLKPFYRADRSRNRDQEGSGIGLAIADRAARLHRGILEVHNNPEGGLTVEICLPSCHPSNAQIISEHFEVKR